MERDADMRIRVERLRAWLIRCGPDVRLTADDMASRVEALLTDSSTNQQPAMLDCADCGRLVPVGHRCMSAPEPEPCGVCKGKGSLRIGKTLSRSVRRGRVVRCLACDGTGQARVSA